MKATENDTSGTSFHGDTVRATVNELTKICGEPHSYNDTSDKVQHEWDMETSDGNVFTIYDWKEYRRYSKDSTIEWHIGAHNPSVSNQAFKELLNALNN